MRITDLYTQPAIVTESSLNQHTSPLPTIRSATVTDVQALLKLNKQLVTESPYLGIPKIDNKVQFEAHRFKTYTTPPNKYLILTLNHQLIGVLRFKDLKNKTGEFGIGILADYQGLGYGRLFITHLITLLQQEHYIRLSLSVSLRNEKALHLYQSLGFTFSSLKSNDRTFKHMTLKLSS